MTRGDSYINRINNLPPGFEYVEDLSCLSCGENTVYGEYWDDTDFDDNGIHNTVHGQFVCLECNYKFNK